MNKILVGSYATSHTAEIVRQRLLGAGVAPAAIAVVRGKVPVPPVEEKKAERPEPGLAGFIGRMFSGAVLEDPRARAYREAAGRGRVVVAVRIDAQEAPVRTILEQYGAVDEHTDGLTFAPGSAAAVPHRESIKDAASTVTPDFGPDINALPNAPTSWTTAGVAASPMAGMPGHDPMRAAGLLNDAVGLGAAAGRRTVLQPGDQRPVVGAGKSRHASADALPAGTSSHDGITATKGVAGGTKFQGDPLLEHIKTAEPNATSIAEDAEQRREVEQRAREESNGVRDQ